MGKLKPASAFEASGGDDCYKTVVDVEQQAPAESYKEVTGTNIYYQPPAPPPSAFHFQSHDTFKMIPDEAEVHEKHIVPEKRILGLRRKTFWIAVIAAGLLLIIIVAAVAGTLAHQKHHSSSDTANTQTSSSSSASSSLSGKPFLPGSSLAIASEDSNARLFYQTGNGNIENVACTMTTSGSQCTFATQLEINDAKLFSPLAGAGTMDTLHLFYLNNNNTVQSKIISSTGAVTNDDTLSALSLAVHNESQLAAIYYEDSLNGNTKTYRLYYQANDTTIKEYVYAAQDGAAWTAGDTLSKAAAGSKIVAMTWKQWRDAGNVNTANDPNKVQQSEVYFTASNGSLIEWDWNGLWSIGTSAKRPLGNSTTALTGVVWEDAPTAYPVFRVYSPDEQNALSAYGPTYNASFPVAQQSQGMGATTADVGFPIAAALYMPKNTTTQTNVSIHVFYQELVQGGKYRVAEKVANSSLDNVDNVTWGNGPGIGFDT